jgi:hypothetical protein
LLWERQDTMAKALTQYSDDESLRRAQGLYEQIRENVEPGNHGKFLIINVDTGDYEMDADDLAASKRAKARFPDARLFTMRIGYPAAYRLGGRFRIRQS